MSTVQGPVRTCVGCRERGPRSALLRVAATSQGDVNVLLVDAKAGLPGRGAWVHPASACVAKAVGRRVFGRALRLAGPVDASRLERWAGQVTDGSSERVE